jgi:cytochrome c oxidase subunit 2
MTLATELSAVVLQAGLVPRGSRVEVFQRIYWVFLALGTLVGIVVIAYMLWKAYKYRDTGEHAGEDVDRPELGELPTGGGGGRKLVLSFGLSTIIVVSLIVWTYGTLLYVEGDDPVEGEELHIEVVGYQFGWTFVYPNGHTSGTLRVPEDTEVRLTVTSDDVFHNFGVPALRVKSDAIPGQTTETWFVANETGRYQAACYELCGQGHSYMDAEVVVMPEDEYQQWYGQTTPAPTETPGGTADEEEEGGGH